MTPSPRGRLGSDFSFFKIYIASPRLFKFLAEIPVFLSDEIVANASLREKEIYAEI